MWFGLIIACSLAGDCATQHIGPFSNEETCTTAVVQMVNDVLAKAEKNTETAVSCVELGSKAGRRS